jgi:Trm5-related predicted tRNA methylase
MMVKLIKALEKAIKDQQTKTNIADKLLKELKKGTKKNNSEIKAVINSSALCGSVKKKLCKLVI